MSTPRQPWYRCGRQGRKDAVRAAGGLNGIDFLEVASADQRTLAVTFLAPLPGEVGGVPAAPALGQEQIVIEGGQRITGIRLTAPPVASGNVLTVTVDRAGDFSSYRLRLVAGAGSAEPPAGFDPRLGAVEFSFKAACPSELDCRVEPDCPPPHFPDVEQDQLVRDYRGFRRLMLERVARTADWRPLSPADPFLAVVEALAYDADQRAYLQDAVHTEGYLATARSRISLRRHARLVDYAVMDGCNARTFVHLGVAQGSAADGAVLPAGTMLFTQLPARTTIAPADAGDALQRRPTVFASLMPITLHAAHGAIPIHTWSDDLCCLPRGATKATLKDDPRLHLAPGDLLLLEETADPATGIAGDADPEHRHVVRLLSTTRATDPVDGTPVLEVAWHAADALPFPLCISAQVATSSGVAVIATALARANVVPADHGHTQTGLRLEPARIDGNPPRPRLPLAGITHAVPFDPAAAAAEPATRFLRANAQDAVPVVALHDGTDRWSPRPDLLQSGRFEPDFVVEIDTDGNAQLRFGDGINGKRPATGTQFEVSVRTGSGPEGNVGRDSLVHVVTALTGIDTVRNPLPATGGTAPQSAASIRSEAPEAFKRQERAVTADDWVAMAERHPEVARAAAHLRWTGSWHTVYLSIDRIGGGPVLADPAFVADLMAHLERYRMAGQDLALRDPVFAPLRLELLVCVRPDHFRAEVARALTVALGTGMSTAGRGFFHPDEFTFGQPVYPSRIHQRASSVPGVASVEIRALGRLGGTPTNGNDGVFRPAAHEIVRLDNDPSFPERGSLSLDLRGGL
ncbi:MAG: putative baseplate assembly protein [Planctomycetes bacterium]|nr:putative baseplate assembly protein [Planctomycetota bacterium]